MNDKAMIEIGRILHIRYNWSFRALTAKEITEKPEYAQFKEKYPELCKLVEEGI